MANPIILFALVASIFSLAALSAHSAALPNHHKQAPPPQPTSKHHPHPAPPHSAPSKKQHGRHHHKRHPHLPAPSPSPVDGRGAAPDPAPEPHLGYAEPADKCLKKLSKECAREIFGGVFGVGKVEDISDRCCLNLVAMGRSCRRGVQAATLALPWLEKREKKVIKKRNAEVWSRCALVAGVLKFAESPFSSPSVA